MQEPRFFPSGRSTREVPAKRESCAITTATWYLLPMSFFSASKRAARPPSSGPSGCSRSEQGAQITLAARAARSSRYNMSRVRPSAPDAAAKPAMDGLPPRKNLSVAVRPDLPRNASHGLQPICLAPPLSDCGLCGRKGSTTGSYSSGAAVRWRSGSRRIFAIRPQVSPIRTETTNCGRSNPQAFRGKDCRRIVVGGANPAIRLPENVETAFDFR